MGVGGMLRFPQGSHQQHHLHMSIRTYYDALHRTTIRQSHSQGKAALKAVLRQGPGKRGITRPGSPACRSAREAVQDRRTGDHSCSACCCLCGCAPVYIMTTTTESRTPAVPSGGIWAWRKKKKKAHCPHGQDRRPEGMIRRA